MLKFGPFWDFKQGAGCDLGKNWGTFQKLAAGRPGIFVVEISSISSISGKTSEALKMLEISTARVSSISSTSGETSEILGILGMPETPARGFLKVGRDARNLCGGDFHNIQDF